MSYIYIKYPMCMYQIDGQTLIVDNEAEEEQAASMGWMTAAQYHGYPSEPAPEPSQNLPESASGAGPEFTSDSDGTL